MLYGLLVTLYVLISFILMGIILVQKSKGSLGIGNIGGSMQMLFGGSGGQSLLQKATWILGAIFMILSLVLALMKSSQGSSSHYLRQQPVPVEQSRNIPTAPQTPLTPMDQPAAPVTPEPAQ
jgi:preprotein translocase subunit SecG